MKKIITGFMVTAFVMGSLPFCHNGITDIGCIPAYAQTDKTEQWSYTVLKDNTIIIDEYHGKEAVIHIPSEIDGYKVSDIEERAFENCRTLEKVTIPDGVKGIGECAFAGCSSLESISIPNSVISVGECAFDGCSSLESINIPDSVTSIGLSAFYDCTGLKYITIGEGVAHIEEGAFIGCGGIKSIVVNEKNKTYDSRGNCNAIIETATNKLILGCQSTVVPKNIKSISYSAFRDCSKLKKITIPNTVTEIGESAFLGCSSLKRITIPNKVRSIGQFAFYNCSSLESITIPGKVTKIDTGTFSGCGSLKKIVVNKKNKKYDSRGNCNAIIETSTNTLLTGCRNTVIPKGIRTIGESAFKGCKGLKKITIPSSVTSIEEGAFVECKSLKKIVVNKKNKKYDSRGNCNAIIETATDTLLTGCKNTVIPKSVVDIGGDAFCGCSGLKRLTIPKSVTNIEKDAFDGCDKLVIYCRKNSHAHGHAKQYGIKFKLM